MNILKSGVPAHKRAVLSVLGCLVALGTAVRGATTTDVAVQDNFTFSPNRVAIKTGDSVRWNWTGVGTHTSTSTNGLWDSGFHSGGTTGFHFTNTFHSAGTFGYVCTPHAGFGMIGAVVVQAASNALPVVAIGQPTNGATFAAPWTGTVHASASDPDGSVAKVQLFSDATVLGTVLNPAGALSFSVTNLPAGTYNLKAVATDNLGATNASAVVSVSVVTPVALVLSAPHRDSTRQDEFDFLFAATPGLTYEVDRSSDLVNWTPLKTFTASNTLEPFLDFTATGAVNFYSVRLLPNP